MQIGEKLKALRKARGATQEALAEAIGVSFQAVSKWETNVSLPDIALLPALSHYFGVSADEILGIDNRKAQEEIEKIYKESWKFRESDPAAARSILEAGLKQYPDNEYLLMNLLYVLDYEKQPEEAARTAAKLIDTATDDAVKYEGYRFLGYAYKAAGDEASAVNAVLQIPDFWCSRRELLAEVASGALKKESAYMQKCIAFESLIGMMERLVECFEAENNQTQALEEAETALKLLSIMGNAGYDRYRSAFQAALERLQGAAADN